MLFEYFLIATLSMLYIDEIFCMDIVEKKYTNYTLYRGIPTSEVQLSFLKNLSNLYDASYWRGPVDYLYKPVHFLIGPEKKKEFLREADHHQVYLTTVREDIQRAFDLQTVKSYIRRNMESFNWHSYYRLKDIYNWLRDLSHANPKVMQVQSIGKSHLKNDIMMVRIVLKESKMRSRVIVEGGIHAREWISPAFVTYMIYQILHAPNSNDLALRKVAETYEWFFVPILNPDGYEISHTKDRMWRKNSKAVDLNRNFGIAFGTVGVSHNPRSEIYCGAKEFSEPESTAMAKFIKSKSKNLEYYLGFHAFGQYMILPYTHTKKHKDNYYEMKMMGDRAAAEIYRRYKTHYTVGTAYDTVGYMTSGVSCCWVKKMYKVPYAVTFELRDDGNYGFALPANQILPTCEETMDGVISLLTPRTKLKDAEELKGSQQKSFLDVLVILWNIVLFIIVRF